MTDIDWNELFKPESFKEISIEQGFELNREATKLLEKLSMDFRIAASIVANRILREAIEKAPRVDCIDQYGDDSPATWHQQHPDNAGQQHKYMFTHTAKLICIEELP